MSIGKRIKDSRKRKGLTLKAVGEHVGRTHSAISQIENGQTTPDRVMLIALAQVLGDDFGEEWLREYLPKESRVDSGFKLTSNVVEGSVTGDPELDAIFFDTKRLSQRKREALKRIIKPIIKEIENYEGDD